MGKVFTAAQLHAAIQQLLACQNASDWTQRVVAYDPQGVPNPLSVKHIDYVRERQGLGAICTAEDLKTLDHLGSLEAFVAQRLHRIPAQGQVTLGALRKAIDPDDVRLALEQGGRAFSIQAGALAAIYRSLGPANPRLRWQAMRVGDGISLAAIGEDQFDLEVISPRPWPQLSAATIDKLWLVATKVCVAPYGQRQVEATGALAVAFARRAWDVYGRILLAEAVGRRLDGA